MANTQKYGTWEVIRPLYEPKNTVFQVRRENGKKRFALKVPYKERLYNFRREVEILKKVDHNNVVKMVDYNLDPEEPYFVMQYVSGGTLADANLSQWTYKEKKHFFYGIITGAEHLYQKGIMTGEWKFSNILVTKNKEAVICDFDVARETKSISGIILSLSQIYFQLMVGENKPVGTLTSELEELKQEKAQLFS